MTELTLQQLTDKMTAIKSDVDKKQGERNAVWDNLSKEFGVKTLDQAYDELDKLDGQLEVLKEKKQELMKSVQERLSQYGY
jgi:3-oxoacyl-ACP reductase-like protein